MAPVYASSASNASSRREGRGVAAAELQAIVALVGRRLVGEGAASRGRRGEEDQEGHSPFHDAFYPTVRRNFQRAPGSKLGIVDGRDLPLKHARVASWSEIGSREAALIQRCGAREEAACSELVDEHQRMVFQLAINLLGDRDEIALDLSQEVFLRRSSRHHPSLSWTFEPAHLDLPHCGESGAQPPPVLAAASSRRPGVA